MSMRGRHLVESLRSGFCKSVGVECRSSSLSALFTALENHSKGQPSPQWAMKKSLAWIISVYHAIAGSDIGDKLHELALSFVQQTNNEIIYSLSKASRIAPGLVALGDEAVWVALNIPSDEQYSMALFRCFFGARIRMWRGNGLVSGFLSRADPQRVWDHIHPRVYCADILKSPAMNRPLAEFIIRKLWADDFPNGLKMRRSSVWPFLECAMFPVDRGIVPSSVVDLFEFGLNAADPSTINSSVDARRAAAVHLLVLEGICAGLATWIVIFAGF